MAGWRSYGGPPMTHTAWPELPLSAWKDTYATLHLWTQIVGKIRLAQTPWLNHSWHVVLYATPRGLTTSLIPYGDSSFQLDFDFIDHVLLVSTSDGQKKEIGLFPRSVADFYADVMRSLLELGIEVRIQSAPQRDSGCDPLQRGPCPRLLRPRISSSASGEFSFSRHACLACFARPSSANAVRSISSGEASISM